MSMRDQARDPPAEPEELVARLRRGDDGSYEELVRRYGGRMLSVATRIVGNLEDGRECVQEAMLQAFKHIGRFEERSTLGTWLHRIVANTALLKLRTRRRRPEVSLDELMPEFDEYQCRVEPRTEAHGSVEALLRRKETREMVRKAIVGLPGDYRDVLLLRDIEEFDTQETANILEITPGTVKTRLHRARAALKKLLEAIRSEDPS